jgi:hypothetical protein
MTSNLIETNIEFTFIPFQNFMLSEIWLTGDTRNFYLGEIVISFN